jgi:hypothetical protein
MVFRRYNNESTTDGFTVITSQQITENAKQKDNIIRDQKNEILVLTKKVNEQNNIIANQTTQIAELTKKIEAPGKNAVHFKRTTN